MIYHLLLTAWRARRPARLIWRWRRLIWRWRRLIWRWRRLLWRLGRLALRSRGLLLAVWRWRRPLRWAVGAVTVIAAGVRLWSMV